MTEYWTEEITHKNPDTTLKYLNVVENDELIKYFNLEDRKWVVGKEVDDSSWSEWMNDDFNKKQGRKYKQITKKQMEIYLLGFQI